MKFAALVCLISVGLLSCSKKSPVIIPNTCKATQQYAKTISQANLRLTGSWILMNFSKFSLPIKQVVNFDTNGLCLITQDGQPYGPFSYSINLTPSFSDQKLMIPQLMVNDSTQLLKLIRISTGQLYIYEEELVIDYGGNLNGSTRTYYRQ